MRCLSQCRLSLFIRIADLDAPLLCFRSSLRAKRCQLFYCCSWLLSTLVPKAVVLVGFNVPLKNSSTMMEASWIVSFLLLLDLETIFWNGLHALSKTCPSCWIMEWVCAWGMPRYEVLYQSVQFWPTSPQRSCGAVRMNNQVIIRLPLQPVLCTCTTGWNNSLHWPPCIRRSRDEKVVGIHQTYGPSSQLPVCVEMDSWTRVKNATADLRECFNIWICLIITELAPTGLLCSSSFC